MGRKTCKPDPAFRSPMTEAEIEELDEHISLHPCRIEWFSTVHQRLFAMHIVSYGYAAQVASTLDFNRTCHVRIVNSKHQVVYSFH